MKKIFGLWIGFALLSGESARAGQPASAGKMIVIHAGVFWMGAKDEAMRDAQPWHRVRISRFAIDQYPVTNAQFQAFVSATGYVTVAEHAPSAQDFPDAPPDNLLAGAVTFTAPAQAVALTDHLQWWRYVTGASWRHPEGPTSSIMQRDHHPVVDVAWADAQAYCAAAGKRLPTEAEFEYAARGGLDRKRYTWGDVLKPNGRWMANIFQGQFPNDNTREDGFSATSPVGAFPANGYGLFDMAGNVWEWCSDWYRADYYPSLVDSVVTDPQGPSTSFDPGEPGVAKRVMRGGSFLCSAQYCARYEAGGRGKGDPDTGTNHLGFRCAQSIEETR